MSSGVVVNETFLFDMKSLHQRFTAGEPVFVACEAVC